jgi:hypothetical protein
MTIPQFEDLSLTVCISGLMLYMTFIMYSLAKESGAGKFGMFVIFLSLGLGMVGFAAKTVIQLLIHV